MCLCLQTRDSCCAATADTPVKNHYFVFLKLCELNKTQDEKYSKSDNSHYKSER